MEIAANEVLILDTNTFVAEIGLTSRDGSALKHYLFRRGMQLVVPEVVAEECERHLTRLAMGKRERIEENLQWLARFCGRVNGWSGPNDETIAERANALVRAEHLGAAVLPDTHEVRARASCRIWEQCLDLLARHRVVFVSNDGDFRGHRHQDKLHPTLRAEAEKVAAGRLAFHPNLESLLSELKSEIQPLPSSMVFDFVYASITADVEKLESNSGCHPTGVGEVKQTPFATEQPGVVEVRLEITDTWESADKTTTMDFRLSGSCQYRLAEEELCDLTPSNVKLLTQEPDGSVRAVKGSYIGLRAHGYLGAPPVQPEPEELVWGPRE